MHYTNHVLPSYFHERDNASRDIFPGKKGNFIDHRSCDIFPHNSPLHKYLGYDKETIRQIMLYQDQTFRSQVQELHRLYRTQRELMEDITMRQIFMRDLQPHTLKPVRCLSQAQEKVEEIELGSFKARDSSFCDKSSKLFIDLNEPLIPEPEPLAASSSTGSCCVVGIVGCHRHVREEAKSESAAVRECCGIDLNVLPPNSYIDLNANGESEIKVPSSPENIRSCQTIISEDVVIEPQRGEGGKVQELEVIAAEALVLIFSSARISRYPSSDVIGNPLSWFADVISSAGDDEEEEEDKVHKRKSRYPFRGVRNETKSCTRSLKSKRASARDNTTRAIEGSKETGSPRKNSRAANVRNKQAKLSSELGNREKRCFLHEWGKMKKRQRRLQKKKK